MNGFREWYARVGGWRVGAIAIYGFCWGIFGDDIDLWPTAVIIWTLTALAVFAWEGAAARLRQRRDVRSRV